MNGVKQDPDYASSDEDDTPLAVKVSSSAKVLPPKRPKKEPQYDDSSSSTEPPSKKIKKEKVSKPSKESKNGTKKTAANGKVKKEKVEKVEPVSASTSPVKSGRKAAKQEDEPVWEWWKEEKLASGVKWNSLHHIGPYFAPPYEPLPPHVRFYYDGQPMKLSSPAEEVASFYAHMLDHDYTSKEIFNSNFFKDWTKYMTSEERQTIRDLSKCNFKEMHAYFQAESEARKNRTKEEKEKTKLANAEIQKVYGYCTLDGYKQKIANFRIEPPGLFRGRGNHPKMGMVKKRILPEDVIINCSRDSVIPKPPEGHKWKEVRHDNSVSWLCCWNENIQGNFKYVMLNASSKLKGEKDWKKYETARKLHKFVDKIRDDYRRDFKDKEMRVRQRAVALYFIDKLALRAGNEKDEDEADTVGCCSLRIEHVKLHEELNDNKYVVEFDFLGKDSIRYQNAVPVSKRVFKNLNLFMKNKQPGDDLFDRLNTTILNQYLRELMDGLTAKVFRTYNASKTLEEQLEALTDPSADIPNKILAYNRANRAVAILCNHQRAVPKTFQKSMENLQAKIKAKQDQIKEAKKAFKQLKDEYNKSKDPKKRALCEQKKKQVATLKGQLQKLEVQATDKDENKEIALGTSKLNYLDPRITVAWCKKWNVPIERVYNKTQREKFQWAIDMATKDFVFRDVTSDVASNKLKKEADSGDEEEMDDDDAGSQ